MADPVVLRVDREISRNGDHIPFHRAGAPTLTFFGGAFDEYGTPADVPAILAYPAFTRNTRFIYGVVESLARMEEPIAFHR
jgi:hypothetical protein